MIYFIVVRLCENDINLAIRATLSSARRSVIVGTPTRGRPARVISPPQSAVLAAPLSQKHSAQGIGARNCEGAPPTPDHSRPLAVMKCKRLPARMAGDDPVGDGYCDDGGPGSEYSLRDTGPAPPTAGLGGRSPRRLACRTAPCLKLATCAATVPRSTFHCRFGHRGRPHCGTHTGSREECVWDSATRAVCAHSSASAMATQRRLSRLRTTCALTAQPEGRLLICISGRLADGLARRSTLLWSHRLSGGRLHQQGDHHGELLRRPRLGPAGSAASPPLREMPRGSSRRSCFPSSCSSLVVAMGLY